MNVLKAHLRITIATLLANGATQRELACIAALARWLRCWALRPAAPARVAQALAPFLLGLAIERLGMRTLLLSSALSLVALASLFPRTMSARV